MIRIFSLLFLLPLTLCAQSGRFILANPSGVSRTEDPVILSRETVAEFVDIPEEGKVAVLSLDGKEIPSQMDDLNGDGRWDELVFLANIERNAKQEIRIRWVSPEKAPYFQKRTHALFGVDPIGLNVFQPASQDLLPENPSSEMLSARYQLGGPAVENEQIAFRYFLGSRNHPGVLGKNRPMLVLDSAGKGTCNPEAGCSWGGALIQTQSTLGIGGFAWVENGLPVPIRNCQTTMARVLTDGPIRSVIETVYEGWKAGEQGLNVRHRIGIWAGKQWCANEVMINGFQGERELALGLSHFQQSGQPLYQNHNKFWISLCTHAKQSQQNDGLGLAVLIRPERFSGYGQLSVKAELPVSNDSLCNSVFARMRIRSGEVLDYYTFAAWEGAEARFGNARYFLDVVQEEADRREFPLKILKK